MTRHSKRRRTLYPSCLPCRVLLQRKGCGTW
nr:MAG TPA: hypothetical protein [Caudoviricetes sp.]